RGVHRRRRQDSLACAVEEREEAVAQGPDLPTAEAVDHGPDALVVLANDPRPLRIADALEHRRGLTDLGEHDRRQHALAEVLGRFPVRMPARELYGLPRDIAVDPCQVSWRNLVRIARLDAE